MAEVITDGNFNACVKENSKPVVVDFWAPWCGPCRAISPIVEELAEEFKGKVDVFKCDVDENSDIVAEYGVRNIPTLIFIKEGKLVDKLVGATTKSAITEKINNLLK
jgi:thioredoxin 1